MLSLAATPRGMPAFLPMLEEREEEDYEFSDEDELAAADEAASPAKKVSKFKQAMQSRR
jgi:hypothetical protein